MFQQPQRYLLVSFSRATLTDDDRGGGHFWPLAAYDSAADALLLMGIDRHKYPPFRVDTDCLRDARATTDTSSGWRRGYSVVNVERLLSSGADCFRGAWRKA